MTSAPARFTAVMCSRATASPSIQPRSAAAFTIAYSPDTWYAATGTSTAARVAMLGAGFWVARGRPTDGRPESTIALTAASVTAAGRRHDLLGAAWLARWGRSQARFPSDVGAGEHAAFAQRILGHPQFR